MQGTLFARHFLDQGIRETPAWRDLAPERLVAFREALERVFAGFPVHGTPNEQELILPVLAALGWQHVLPQQGTAGRGRTDVPDQLLFANADAKAAAQGSLAKAQYRV